MKRIILVLVMLVFIPRLSYSRFWYIKDDGTGDAPTISAGIDSCTVGDIVIVAYGLYSLSSPIYIGSSAADSILVHADAGPNRPIIDCTSSGFGFVIEGRNSKFLAIGVFEVINASNAAFAINLSTNNPIHLWGNIIHSNSGYGIVMSQSSEVILIENIIYSNQKGVACIESGGIEIIRNDIAYHTGPQAYGLYLDSAYMGNTVRGNIICHNQAILGVTEENTIFECNDIFSNIINLDSYIGVDGNIAEDPQFCSSNPEVDGNFFLQSDSPCWLGNHPNGSECGLIGVLMTGCETTGTEERSWGDIKKMMKSSSNSR